MVRDKTTTLSYKIITLTLYSRKGLKLLWCVREIQRERLLYWPITSSIEHITLCYLQGLTFSLPTRLTRIVRTRGLLDRMRTRFSICQLDWTLQGGIDRLPLRPKLSRAHVHMLFHNAHDFRSTHDCSRLFSRVRPTRKISDWRLGQESICNIIIRCSLVSYPRYYNF